MAANFGVTDLIVTYRIHQSTGLIERIVPSELPVEKRKDARYIYVSSDGKEHDFGVFIGQNATRWIRKNVAGTETIYLMNVEHLGSNPARNFGFRFSGTQRRFLNQIALGSLIGALMELGYEDIASTGFSNADGSPGVSTSHINGENGDFRFMRTDNNWNASTHLNTVAGVNALDEVRQNAMNDALFKFGWKTQYAWRYTNGGEQKLLARTVHYADHHHHLHVGGFAPEFREIAQ